MTPSPTLSAHLLYQGLLLHLRTGRIVHLLLIEQLLLVGSASPCHWLFQLWGSTGAGRDPVAVGLLDKASLHGLGRDLVRGGNLAVVSVPFAVHGVFGATHRAVLCIARVVHVARGFWHTSLVIDLHSAHLG